MFIEDCGHYTSERRVYPLQVTDWNTALSYAGSSLRGRKLGSDFFVRKSVFGEELDGRRPIRLCDGGVLIREGVEVYWIRDHPWVGHYEVARTIVTQEGVSMEDHEWDVLGILPLRKVSELLVDAGGVMKDPERDRQIALQKFSS